MTITNSLRLQVRVRFNQIILNWPKSMRLELKLYRKSMRNKDEYIRWIMVAIVNLRHNIHLLLSRQMTINDFVNLLFNNPIALTPHRS